MNKKIAPTGIGAILFCHFIFPLTSLLKGGERVEKIFIHSNADSHIYIAI